MNRCCVFIYVFMFLRACVCVYDQRMKICIQERRYEFD